MRLDVRRVGQVKAGENNTGNRTRVKIVKNKMAPPFGMCEFDIRFGRGMDALGDLLDIAAESGVVSTNGAYYSGCASHLEHDDGSSSHAALDARRQEVGVTTRARFGK